MHWTQGAETKPSPDQPAGHTHVKSARVVRGRACVHAPGVMGCTVELKGAHRLAHGMHVPESRSR